MTTMIAALGLCSRAFERAGATTHTHWQMTVSGAHSASDDPASNDDPNMGPTGGFIPDYLLKKIRKNRKEDHDSSIDDGATDREILEGDGGTGSDCDPNQEGSDAPTTGRLDDGEALHGERCEGPAESDLSTEEGRSGTP